MHTLLQTLQRRKVDELSISKTVEQFPCSYDKEDATHLYNITSKK